jgi:hypothetical protein
MPRRLRFRANMHRSAITRVEIAIIIGLGLLVAGLLAVLLSRQRENGMRLQCMNNLRRIGDAVHGFHEGQPGADDLQNPGHGYLPPARIADGYATWAVLLAPYLTDKNPLHDWDVSKSYLAQPPSVREALVTGYFCPARARPAWLSTTGEKDLETNKHVPGALGDYAGVAGSGDPARPWDGPNADGLIIIGEVLDWADDQIVRWRGRTRLPDVRRDATARGLSTTLLFGEKHVPPDTFGNANKGDGSLYDGHFPASVTRVAGPGYGLAASPTDPFNHNFGSAHPRISHFLFADGSVRPFTADVNEDVLGNLARREK